MYDKDLTNKWLVEIEFSEDDVHTMPRRARRLRDDTMSTTGDAYRNPRDPGAPMIGEEIAAARALITLGTELLHEASARRSNSPRTIRCTCTADRPVKRSTRRQVASRRTPSDGTGPR